MKPGVDFIGVGVGALIVDDEGRVFMALRGPESSNERGLWEFPGGSVQYGERLVDALKREIKEEFDVEIEVGELLDVVDHLLSEEGQHWVSPTYICHICAGNPRICEPGKCEAIDWFAPDAVPENLTQISRINLEHFRERLNGDQKAGLR